MRINHSPRLTHESWDQGDNQQFLGFAGSRCYDIGQNLLVEIRIILWLGLIFSFH